MPADIEVRVEPPLLVAYQNKALLAHRYGEKIARRGDLLLAANHEPTLVEDLLEFLLINRVGLILFAGQGQHDPRDVVIDASLFVALLGVVHQGPD